MTQDEIIETAKKAGIPTGSRFVGGEVVECLTLEVQAFAKLVAAKERGACAEICKKHADVYGAFEPTPAFQAAWAACIDLRDKIQARGEE